MNNNERIAEWAGAKPRDYHETIPVDGALAFTSDCWTPGNRPIIFRHKAYPGFSYAWMDWEPDTDITLWHGEDGLLKTIENRSKIMDFQDAFTDESDPPLSGAGERFNLWAGFNATPAQLVAALVKVIKAT